MTACEMLWQSDELSLSVKKAFSVYVNIASVCVCMVSRFGLDTELVLLSGLIVILLPFSHFCVLSVSLSGYDC